MRDADDVRSPLLLIEDNPRDAALIQLMLGRDCAVEWVDRLSGGLDVIQRKPVDEVLLDLNLPDSSGVDALTALRRAAPDAAIVVVSGQDDPNVIDEALRYGAVDYLIKGELNPQLLSRVIRFARERQAARASIDASEERFRRVLESVQEGLVVHDGNGIITFANEGVMRMMALPPQAMIGKHVFDVVPPETVEPFRRSIERHRKGASDRFSVDIRRPDGTSKRLRVSAAPLLDAEGNYAGSVATLIDAGDETARDITDNTHNLDWKNHLAAAVESSDDAIFTADRNGLIVTWNRGAERLFGYTREEMTGLRAIRDLAPPDRLHEVAQALEVIRGGQSVEHSETHCLTRNGDLVDVSLTMSPIRDGSGAVVALTAIVRDVTTQKRAERQLEQANRISSLGRLAGNIAHEFNNVLMGIQPFAELIEVSSTDQKIRKAAGQIRGSVNRGKSIVADILRPTQLKPPETESLEILPWLEQVMKPELTAVLTESVALEIRVESPALRVRANPRQLAQVLVNLTVNAKHAMPEGGRFSISVRRCVAGDRFRSGTIRDVARFAEIKISDTGAGMDAATLDRIFEPLFTTKRTGTGLGLPLAHQVVQQHGGHMFVESSPGIGTTVYIFLPLAEESAAGAKTGQEAMTPRILIAEDEAPVAAGIRDLLSLEGFDTMIVEDGASVIAAVESFRPDVVLLDVSLPDISGFEVHAILTERWPDLPVIFSTGHATEKDLEHLPRSRFVSLLRKPYDFRRLTAEVSRALGK